jgi:hypothetical protein
VAPGQKNKNISSHILKFKWNFKTVKIQNCFIQIKKMQTINALTIKLKQCLNCWSNSPLLLRFHSGNSHRPNRRILKGEVSLYCWPPVLQIKTKLSVVIQLNPKQSNRRSMVHYITLWYFTLLEDTLLGSDLFRYYIYVTYSINK